MPTRQPTTHPEPAGGRLASADLNVLDYEQPIIRVIDPEGDTALYARISDDTNQDAFGVRDQLHRELELASRRQWSVHALLVDNDVSASAFSRKRRPAHEWLVESVRKGKVRRIVVCDVDRIYRQLLEFETLRKIAKEAQNPAVMVDLAAPDSPLPLTDDAARDLPLTQIKVLFAAQEVAKMRERQKRHMAGVRREGRWTGSPRPFGWKKLPLIDPVTGKQATDSKRQLRWTWRIDQVDGDAADCIREGVKAILDGASLQEIAKRWNTDARAKQPRGSRGWTGNTVRAVLVSPRIAGLVPAPRGDGTRQAIHLQEWEREGTWPVIVDRESWERCRAILVARTRTARHPRRESLLTGLVFCGQCGEPMYRGGWNDVRYWRCRGDEPGLHGCGKVAIKAVLDFDRLPDPAAEPRGLEDVVLTFVFDCFDTGELRALIEDRDSSEERALVQSELADLRRYREETKELMRQRRIGPRDGADILAGLDADERRLTDRLGGLSSIGKALDFAGRPGMLRQAWPRLTLRQKRRTISAALEGGRISVQSARAKGGRFDQSRVGMRR